MIDWKDMADQLDEENDRLIRKSTYQEAEIERLRAGYEAAKKSQRGAEAAYEKAEAEIDRLRAALREVERWADYHDATGCLQVVREALGVAEMSLTD